MAEKLIGADYLLALLYCDNKSPVKGSVRLTKMMYLFNKEIKPIIEKKGGKCDKLPEFIPYNFGPFSKDLYEQIELFKGIKFISTKEVPSKEVMVEEVDDWEENPYIGESLNDEEQLTFNKKYVEYVIAEKGVEYYESVIKNQLNQAVIELLEQFKKKIVRISVKNLLYYVYSKYPDMTVNSIIKKDVLGSDEDD